MRLRAKIGAFYPSFSLENRDIAWNGNFSTTPSVINSWVGEELRTIGAEVGLDWPGRFRQSASSWKLTGAVHGSNDAAGTILDHRGWANHDRQTGLFSALRLPTLQTGEDRYIHPFYENDDDPGYYLTGEWRYLDQVTLQASHYDNRSKTGHSRDGQSGWRTRFNQLAMQWRLPNELTLAAQVIDGSTLAVNPGSLIIYHSDFSAFYVLFNKVSGKHSWTARYEQFSVDDLDHEPLDFSEQDGDSFLLSWQYRLSEQWRAGAEWLLFDSDRLERQLSFGQGHERINQLMLTLQYRFHN